MSEDRTRILGMLADGKITAAEAETLLDALGSTSAVATAAPAPVTSPSADWPTGPNPGGGTPKFMYVKVTGDDKVDVKVPLALLRTGLKLTSLIPPAAMDEINKSMGEAGMSIDFNNLKPEDIEDLIASLGEMEVNVQAADGNHVRVFCA
jgi:hypothetical protein